MEARGPQRLNPQPLLPARGCTPEPPCPQAPPERGGIQASVRQLVVLKVELTEVGLATQGSSGHLGDEVVLGREERVRLRVQDRGQWRATEGS